MRFVYLLMRGDTHIEKMIPHSPEQLALCGVEHMLPLEGVPLEEEGGGRSIEAFGVNMVKDNDDGKLTYVAKLFVLLRTSVCVTMYRRCSQGTESDS